MGGALDRLYRRDRRRYLLLGIGAEGGTAMLIAMAGVYGYAHYEGGRFSTFLPMASAIAAALAVAFWGTCRQLVHASPALAAWVREGPTASCARDAWPSVASLPTMLHARLWRNAVFVGVTAVAMGIGTVDHSMLGAVWASVGTITVILLVLMFAYPIATVLTRPVLHEISGYLPLEFAPTTRSSFQRITIMMTAAIIYFSMIGGGLFTSTPGGGPADGLRLLVIGVFAAATVGVPCSLLFAELILGPVAALIDTADRVGEGDLDARTPLLSDDELGRLADSFNEMLDELSRRAAALAASRARIVAASDAARRAVERDLHDGAQQSLVLLSLRLAEAERTIEADPKAALAMHRDLRHDLNRALAELRELAHGIYPKKLESDGLRGALDEVTRRTAIPTELACDGTRRYRADIEAAVYFCCLEALQNAAKHGGEAAHASVRLADREGALEFEIRDHGRGFDVRRTEHSTGLQNMIDRIGAVGGELTIDSSLGRGTTIRGTVPTDARDLTPDRTPAMH